MSTTAAANCSCLQTPHAQVAGDESQVVTQQHASTQQPVYNGLRDEADLAGPVDQEPCDTPAAAGTHEGDDGDDNKHDITLHHADGLNVSHISIALDTDNDSIAPATLSKSEDTADDSTGVPSQQQVPTVSAPQEKAQGQDSSVEPDTEQEASQDAMCAIAC